MGKVKTKQELGKPSASVWADFKGLTAHDIWTIQYNVATGRAVLRQGSDFKVSDVSLNALKRYAELQYGIPEGDWRSIQE